MTLATRFSIMIVFLFCLMFSGAVVISTYLNHQYMQQQLKSNAEDTATSLGLILSNSAANDDAATMTSMVDAVFDRGYFQSIQLRDMKGKLLVDRHLDVKVSNVPQWFIELFPFTSPKSSSLVMSGWQQLGKLTVRSHPGYAYLKLWNTLLAFLFYSLFIARIALVIGLISIHLILRPVRQMGAQAQAIIDGHFPIIEKLPKPYHLRKTVQVMNRMSRKLKNQFEQHRLTASRLRKMVYHDPLTGLNNRLYFNNHLKHEVTLAREHLTASVMLIEVEGIKALNYAYGFYAGDDLLIRCARTLERCVADVPSHFLARLYGANFAVLFINEPSDIVERCAKQINDHLSELAAEVNGDRVHINTHIGIVDVTQGVPTKKILLAADMALTKARQQGDFNFDHESFDALNIQSEDEWQRVIHYIIEHASFQLLFDPCYRMRDNEILFHEVLLQAHDEQGGLRRASNVYAMAERFGLAASLDKKVIEATLNHAQSVGYARDRYVLNLSMGALGSRQFMNWLRSTLKQVGDLADHLFFEVSEFAAVHHLAQLQELIEFLKPLGTGVGLDHFGKASSSFAYLRRLGLSYVKVDASFIRNLQDDEDNLFYISSLVAVAHSLDIPVLADQVETLTQYNLLKSLQVDAAQGIYFQLNG